MKKMMYMLALSSVLTGLSLAQGAPQPQPEPRPAIEGDWGMRMDQGPLVMEMTFSVRNNTLTLTNVCTVDGRSATARVSSPVSYDERTLTVFATANDDESSNGVSCNVSIKPDRMGYEVRGNLLVLSHEGSPDQFVLTRK